MTARRTILSRFRRRPRPTDPEPPRDWLDGLDGLPGRMTAPCPVCGAPDHVGWAGTGSQPGRTRYDAEWPDVLAAETPGGDLAAMAAPLPGMVTHTAGTYIFTDVTLTPPAHGMARDALGTYAEYDDMGEWTTPAPYVPAEIPNHAWTVRDVRAAMAAYDLGLGPVRRSDPPLYVACLVDAGTP